MPDTREESHSAAEINGRSSHDDLRRSLSEAVRRNHGEDAYLQDTTDTDALVRRQGKTFRVPYQMKDGAATLGSPVEVKVTYRDVDSARKAGDVEGQAFSDPGTLAFATILEPDAQAFADGAAELVEIEVCKDGKWKHPRYGDVTVTPTMRDSMVRNFSANVRKVGDLPVDYDHNAGPAAGWIQSLRNDAGRLLAKVALTPTAREQVAKGEYKFFSPEWHPDWEDPESGKRLGPTLFGGGLTNRPFFRGMAAVQCSENPVSLWDQGEGTVPETKTKDAAETEESRKAAEAEATRKASEEAARKAAEAQQGTEPAGMTAAEAQQLREEVASLRAAEERRVVDSALSSLTFSDAVPMHKTQLAPASRTKLAEELMKLPAANRTGLLEALKSLQFAELGERGFVAAENGSGGNGAMDPERKKKLLSATPIGRACVAAGSGAESK